MSGPPLWRVDGERSSVFLYGQGPWGVTEDDPWWVGAPADVFERSAAFWHEVPDDPRLVDGDLIARFGLESNGEVRPWLTAQLLDMELRAGAGADGSLVDVEGELTARARAAGKRVSAEFEDAETLLTYFATLDAADEYVAWTSDRVEQGAAELRRQAEAWLAGDLAVFEDDIRRVRRLWPRLYEVLLRDRNMAWIPRIQAVLDGGDDTFVVMGMGHLAGDEGVVTLLRDRSVERVQ